MKKSVKILIVTASVLVVSGILLCIGALAAVGFDIEKLSTVTYVTNTHEVSAGFGSISVDSNTSDITFALTDEKACKVVCFEQGKISHTVDVQDNTLVIRQKDERKWFDYINISFRSPKVTVYLPKTDYAALTVKSTTGNVNIPEAFTFDSASIRSYTGNVSFGASVKNDLRVSLSTGNTKIKNASASGVSLSSSTGNIELENVKAAEDLAVNTSTGNIRLAEVTCKNCRAEASTGNITLSDTVASGDLRLTCSTGNIRFSSCDAADITAKTSTGNITGSLRSEKIFYAESSTGSVDVPRGAKGGTCNAKSDTGNIRISVE